MNKNRLMAGAMAVTVTIGTIGMAGVNVYAADGTESQKEEVIYIMTDADGNVDNINAVNIFGKGDVTDYGDYSSVKMLNTTDKINQSGDKITFSSDKEKVYYQGTMKDTQIPWNISFTYTLDGKEIAPEDLAGKSGALTIHVKVDKNEECTSDFYDNTALQATLTLDTEKCENITADGATLANVGANKQISYTVLPGKGLDAEVSADVTDFEMDAITINGVKMNLDVDIDDDELMDKVTQIMDASRELNDGAGELVDGAGELADGTGELVDGGSNLVNGAESLDSGINSLNSGISSLSDGVNNMQSALNQLNGKSGNLTNGSAAVKQGIASVASGSANLQSAISYDAYKATMSAKGLDIDELQAGNTQAIAQISSQSSQLSTAIDKIKSTPGYEYNQVFKDLVAQLENQKNSLDNIQTLLTGNNAALSGANQYYSAVAGEAGNLTSGLNELNSNYETLDSGINEYTNGVSQITSASAQLVEGTGTLASGSKELVKGSSLLKEGTSTLYSGMQSLNDGANELNDGTKELKDGTQEFFDKTDGMDTQIEDTMDEMLDSITGGDSETESFVSGKNGTIDSVQFVIKASAIEKQDTTKKETTETKELSLGQKILKLFGIEK